MSEGGSSFAKSNDDGVLRADPREQDNSLQASVGSAAPIGGAMSEGGSSFAKSDDDGVFKSAIRASWTTQCRRRDSNPHTRRHRNLNPACLPVPPLRQY